MPATLEAISVHRPAPLVPERRPMPRVAAVVGASLGLALLAACAGPAADAGASTDSTLSAAPTPVERPSTGAGSASVASTAPAASGRRVVLAVRGMSCESCERTVGAMLRRTPGVLNATVSVERGEAVVTYDPARTTPADLASVVRRLGYEADPWGG